MPGWLRSTYFFIMYINPLSPPCMHAADGPQWSKIIMHRFSIIGSTATHLNVSTLTQSSSLRSWLGSMLVKTRSPFPVNSLKRSLQNGTDCASVPLISWVAAANITNSARAEEAMICDRGLSSWNEFLKFGSSQLDDHDNFVSSFYSTRASDRSCITWAARARTRTSSRATFPESNILPLVYQYIIVRHCLGGFYVI